jgi:hypothetical protein
LVASSNIWYVYKHQKMMHQWFTKHL